jgi:hypothetical protein
LIACGVAVRDKERCVVACVALVVGISVARLSSFDGLALRCLELLGELVLFYRIDFNR